MPKKHKKLKRAFLDIEFRDERTLELQLEQIKRDLLRGIESKSARTQYYTKYFNYSFKQWFNDINYKFAEQVINDKNVVIIKSKV